MWENAVWIGIPREELETWSIVEGDLTGRFVYYRLEADLERAGKAVIDISANSRYRLWINEKPVLSGPCKGDGYRQYYETVDISEYLKPGKNVFAVQVLYSNPYSAVKQTDERAAIFGVVSLAAGHRLALEGTVSDQAGEKLADLTTGVADWKVYLEGSSYLRSTGEMTANLGAVCEKTDFQKVPSDWKKKDYDSSHWRKGILLEHVRANAFEETAGLVSRFQMKEREIPLLYEKEEILDKTVSSSHWSGMVHRGADAYAVPAGKKQRIVFDAERIVNGYPQFSFGGGKGAKVTITYFEKFLNRTEEIRRDDAEHGYIDGITDEVVLNGAELVYEPFWYRTFRFISVEVETKEEELILKIPKFRKTGYPLEVCSKVGSTEKWVKEVWDMCVRTLENCMMETYMDCPYYEQMQFPMDTRLQALFTYAVSGDTRMAKKALEDYHCSMLPCGLIPGKYPSAYLQVISTFSLHYIYMLKEYYWQTGDLKTVRSYFADMDRILDYYDSKIGEDGMVGRLGYWEFVDWQPAWGNTSCGMPEAVLYGPSAIINLMYCYALENAAQLNEYAGRSGMAEEYRKRRQKILVQVQEKCWDEKREMYREGPDFEQYTCHAQAWAVLNHLPEKEMGKKILKHAAEEEDVLKCTFSTAYEWFRACEKAEVYEYTKADLAQWIRLPEEGCTCCPETPVDARSDCHAWSALPMYELLSGIAGIKAAEPGWKSVQIRPHIGDLSDFTGEMVTPKGSIIFEVKTEKNGQKKEQLSYKIRLPEGMEGVFTDEQGKETQLKDKTEYCIKLRS